MKPVIALLISFLFLSLRSYTQNILPVRTLPAKRFTGIVKLDGIPNEAAWQEAAFMTDLIAFRPKVGERESPATRTEAYLMYND